MVCSLFYFSLAWASVVQENTIEVETPLGSYSDLFVNAQSYPPIPRFDLRPTEDGYCVSFVQKNGYQSYHGNANDWIKYINSDTPSIGAVAVMSYGYIDHLELVVDIDSDGVHICDQNFTGQGIVDCRIMDKYHLIGYVR